MVISWSCDFEIALAINLLTQDLKSEHQIVLDKFQLSETIIEDFIFCPYKILNILSRSCDTGPNFGGKTAISRVDCRQWGPLKMAIFKISLG